MLPAARVGVVLDEVAVSQTIVGSKGAVEGHKELAKI